MAYRRAAAVCLPAPSSVQNYVFGVTRIEFWPYAAASLLFTIPQTVFYVYLGSVGPSVLLGRRIFAARRPRYVRGPRLPCRNSLPDLA